nr:uncharacterized protein LOC104117463 isoform X2 [Nicotiana tomentosiformis]
MANLPINLPKFKQILISLSNFTNLSSHFFPYSNSKVHYQRQILKKNTTSYNYRLLSRRSFVEYEDEDYLNSENYSFQEAVALFNSRDYYRCHDVLEALWNESEEPIRTLLHGILQCAVGFHHLFNQNHKGAMMELGEGLSLLKGSGSGEELDYKGLLYADLYNIIVFPKKLFTYV